MDLKIIPAKSAADCEKNYDKELWRKFARRIIRNPFVRNFLAQRDLGVCAWCGEKMLEDGDIHHTTYDHACSFEGTIVVRQQTVQRHSRKRQAPDCARCKAADQARFDVCMGKLVLVHPLCNKEISATQPPPQG
ncbi:MAG TPA: hypothetical protein DCZ92_08845 [Elusimicrobia bacterium]|nr:MAG: hypothetical protein A2016_01680 [Elusimicrobia bacterium GWF2_62_30]HBA60912.1 hypothetical protein [Elusimicrobiota bacterium]